MIEFMILIHCDSSIILANKFVNQMSPKMYNIFRIRTYYFMTVIQRGVVSHIMQLTTREVVIESI